MEGDDIESDGLNFINRGGDNEDLIDHIRTHCEYQYTLNDIEGSFNVIQLNVRSLKNKFDDLHNFLVNTGITWDVICIAETWLKNDIIEYYNLDHYNLFVSCRDTGEGGGVAVYVHDRYDVRERKDLESIDCETKFVELTLHLRSETKHIIVGEIYRPPNHSSKVFLEYMEQLLENLENEKKIIVLAGDFNYNLLANKGNDSNNFTNLLSSYGFSQMIWKATRKQRQCESLLDNIFINDLSIYNSSGIIIDDLSDHLPVFATMKIETKKSEHNKRITTFDRRKIPELADYLDKRLEHFQKNRDANVACKELIQAYSDGIKLFSKSFTPCRRKTPIKPWVTPGLLCSINTKNKLYKKLLRNANITNETNYKRYRNILVYLIRDAKKKYIRESLEGSKNDSKLTWQVLNNLMNKSKTKQGRFPDAFYDSKGHCFKGEEIPEGFNNFFATIGVELDKNIPVIDSCPLQYIKEPLHGCLTNVPRTTPKQITNIIKSLNPVGGGIDGINSFILLGTYQPLLPHLTFFFNLCLTTAVFPDKLKIAIIAPIHKTGAKDQFNNYRPISLLPVFSKILEKIIHSTLMTFLNDNNILNPFQFGFRKQHSTYMPIVHMYDEITKSLQNSQLTCSIYLDLKKAFDTVCLEILLKKIYRIGIRGDFYSMIESYLKNRYQMTKINDVISKKQMIKMGVPQGSIIGPLLFILYINDISHTTNLGTFYLFADDTAICIKDNNVDELQRKINSIMLKINEWFNVNRLSLNVSKTNYQIYSRSEVPDLDIILNNTPIVRKACIKYLGVHIDENLKWSSHINSISSVISRNIGVMGRSRHYLSSQQLRLLYHTLILPYLNYCAIIWGRNYASNINQLVVLQKRALRIIDKKPFLHHSKPLFIKHRILRLPEVVKEQSIMIILSYINNNLPTPISSMFKYCEPTNTRLPQHFFVPFASTNYRLFSLSCSAPQIWNTVICKLYKNLNEVPKHKHTLKKAIRIFFLDSYSD